MGQIIDIVLVVVILFFAIRALSHGFVKEVFSLLAFILAAWGTKVLSPIIIANIFNTYADTRVYFIVIVYGVVFLVIYILTKIVEIQLSRVIHLILLTGLDRILGLLFGVLESIVIILVLVYVLRNQNILDIDFDNALSQSKIISLMENYYNATKAFFKFG